MPKRVLFLTGTRADFGKLKPLMHAINDHPEFELDVFVTGMHMLSRYGYTRNEVEKEGFHQMYCFINQNEHDSLDIVLSKTIAGISDFIKENPPDLMVVHGDRVEALACAIVASLNNVLVAHIEGGEVSGTIDELIRHSVSKLSHLHFVANDVAARRLVQLGEREELIHVIGSPDIDIMASSDLPPLEEVLSRYEIEFESYAIVLLHPVTTETDELYDNAMTMVTALKATEDKFVVIYPNNDPGSNMIFSVYRKHVFNDARFQCFPSLRFEYFLTLLRHAKYIIGNSSAGVREAPFFGVPSIDVGNRQANRASAPSVQHTNFEVEAICAAIDRACTEPVEATSEFGDGSACDRFMSVMSGAEIWSTEPQKYFVDLSNPGS